MESIIAIQACVELGERWSHAFARIIAVASRTVTFTTMRETKVAGLAAITLASDHVLAALALSSEGRTRVHVLVSGAARVTLAGQCAVVVLHGQRHDRVIAEVFFGWISIGD